MKAVADVIHTAFHRPDTRLYKVVNGAVWLLIVASVGLFVLELTTAVDLTSSGTFALIDRVILLLFGAEITLRIGSYRPPELSFYRFDRAARLRATLRGRLLYAAEPLNLADILTVLALIPELRGLRALRLLRLVRVRVLFRYSNPIASITRAIVDNRLLYYAALSLLGMEVLIGGLTVWLSERAANPAVNSMADGFWWALVTLTTVGFGDISPVTPLGRFIGAVLMMGGVFTLAVFAGIVGRTLLTSALAFNEEQHRMIDLIDHVIICGYHPGARMLLDTVREEIPVSVPVLIMAPGARPQDIPPEMTWIHADPTKERELDKADVAGARAVIIVGDRAALPQQADAVTIMTAFTVRAHLARQALTARRERPLHIVAEILDPENAGHAQTAGADEVILSTRLGFSLLAHAVQMPGTAAIVGSVASAGAHSLYIGRVPAEVATPTTFGELAGALKLSHGVLLIGVRDDEDAEDRLNPQNDYVIGASSRLLYLAKRPVLPR